MAGLIYFFGFQAQNPAGQATALYKHLTKVAESADKQKRALGSYALNLQALISKDIYLTATANHKGYTRESELQVPWNGPYLKNVPEILAPPKRPPPRYLLPLTDIAPHTVGELKALAEPYLQYSVTYTGVPARAPDFMTIAWQILEKCNGRHPPRTAPGAAGALFSSAQAHLQPCGFRARQGIITAITYYVAALK